MSGSFDCFSGTFNISENSVSPPIPRKGFSLLPSDEKASKLVLGLYDKLGFQQVITTGEILWVLQRNEQSIAIKTNGAVYLNGDYRCVHAMETTLPFADNMFAKLISLATEVRTKVSTLKKEDLDVLESLLPLKETQVKIQQFLEEKEMQDVLVKTKDSIIAEGSNSEKAD